MNVLVLIIKQMGHFGKWKSKNMAQQKVLAWKELFLFPEGISAQYTKQD